MNNKVQLSSVAYQCLQEVSKRNMLRPENFLEKVLQDLYNKKNLALNVQNQANNLQNIAARKQNNAQLKIARACG